MRIEHTLRHLERDKLCVLSCDAAFQYSCHIVYIDYYMRTSSYPPMKADKSAMCTINRHLQRIWGYLFLCIISQDGCPDYPTVSKLETVGHNILYSYRMLALIAPFRSLCSSVDKMSTVVHVASTHNSICRPTVRKKKKEASDTPYPAEELPIFNR